MNTGFGKLSLILTIVGKLRPTYKNLSDKLSPVQKKQSGELNPIKKLNGPAY